MSIVPYNNENLSIVLRSPELGSIVLYNKATKSLELVNLDSSGHIPDAEDFYDSKGRMKRLISSESLVDSDQAANSYCPHCGQEIPNDDKRRQSSTQTRNFDLENFRSAGPSMRSDYFRLLASGGDFSKQELFDIIKNRRRNTLLEDTDPHFEDDGGDESVIGERSNGGDLFSDEDLGDFPATLFTQGYFKKFFRVKQRLGNGSNGTVLKVEHVLHNLPLGVFALKKIPIGSHLSNLPERLKEVKLLFQLTEASGLDTGIEDLLDDDGNSIDGKESLIKYNHVWLEIDQVSDFSPRVPCVFILFEYCDGGNLEELVESLKHPIIDIEKTKLYRRARRTSSNEATPMEQQPRFLNAFEIYKIFRDIVVGVSYLHRSHILHRDLKPANCLLKQQFTDNLRQNPICSVSDLHSFPSVTVSDFGEGIMEGMKRESTGATGTIEFSAPELFFRGQNGALNDFTTSSDVYSLGMILYYLCFGELPYTSDDPEDVRKTIEHSYKNDANLSSFGDAKRLKEPLMEDWLKLISRMLEPQSYKRPNCLEILADLVKIFHKLQTLDDKNTTENMTLFKWERASESQETLTTYAPISTISDAVLLEDRDPLTYPPVANTMLNMSQLVTFAVSISNFLIYKYVSYRLSQLVPQNVMKNRETAFLQRGKLLELFIYGIFLCSGIQITSPTPIKLKVFLVELLTLLGIELVGGT
ncbi:unnamed protein product [Kuraishia capsulata CBS 1993]|uniref:Protein kinase domain-containing protein n=1 Tax=Kuraishia capsulata CBS 1993 TaxID=1382522 RepID=W6MF69_9ASCO|nr:uncharacterized protein KUCA_T00000299001 [Kuraishia capsulata CBS 1993]CDK24339.1 unnamed protein product [Kuraishia capsulata CBS 1993]